jgi:4-amino-4-deoxy-L-arabinose transferase-like glycosyltransferase
MLAVMTKSTAGLLFLPALFIYSLIRKKFLTIFKMKEFYLGLLIFFVPILTYYIGREIYNPGYINTVIENEYGQRYLTTIENHKGDFWFYWQNFLAFQITKWYWLIPCGIVVGVSSKNELVKKLSLFITIVSVSFFLLISFSQTKCEWYDVPIYPFLAMIIGMFLYLVFDFLKNLEKIKTLFKWNIIPFVFLFIVMIDPYRTIINKVYFPKEYFWDEEFYQISYFLQDATKGERAIDNSLLCYDGYNAHLLFYLDVLNDKGHKIDFADWHKLHVNEKAIAYQGDVKKYIEENYSFEIIRDDKSIRTYKITGIKKMS